MPEIEKVDVSFYSGSGTRLSSHVYLPERSADRGCGIVFCHGFGGVKEGTPPGLARAMAARGYTILAFDYRGFGESDGPRGHLAPQEQVEDAMSAIEHLAQSRPHLHSIGIYGNSFGGGIALMAARLNRRVKVGFVSVPVTSGSRWLKSVHRYCDYLLLRERATQALAERTVSGRMEMAERFTLVPPDPASRERHTVQQFFTLESFIHIMNHEPIEIADQIDIPIGIVGIESDLLVPFEQSENLYRRLAGPKELYAFPSGDHHSIYDEDGLFRQVSARVISWFDRYFSVPSTGSRFKSGGR